MKIENAKLCMDCEEVFEKAENCPHCGSSSWWYLCRWVPSIRGGEEAFLYVYPKKKDKRWK